MYARSRSPVRASASAAAGALQAEVAVRRAAERHVQDKFKQTCHAVNREMLQEYEDFPVTADGELWWDSQGEFEQMAQQIRAFCALDLLVNNGRAAAMWPAVLAMAYPWTAGKPLDWQLLALVLRCLWHRRRETQMPFQYVEYFCGVGNLSKACIKQGLTGCSFDLIHSEEHDVLTAPGLRLWLTAYCAVQQHGLVCLGVECSSFVVLSRSQSLRSSENAFNGDETKDFAQTGNALASIGALIMLLCKLLDCVCVVEQPLNSCLLQSQPFKGVCMFCEARAVHTYHRAFGGETLKPLQLWTWAEAFQLLRRARPPGAAVASLATRDSNGRFTGVRQMLKASQAYTRLFGDAARKPS